MLRLVARDYELSSGATARETQNFASLHFDLNWFNFLSIDDAKFLHTVVVILQREKVARPPEGLKDFKDLKDPKVLKKN